MLEFDRIDFPEGVDANKTIELRGSFVCRNWYVLESNCRFQPKVCNGYHSLMQKAMNFNEAAIASVKRNIYRILFWSKMKPKTY